MQLALKLAGAGSGLTGGLFAGRLDVALINNVRKAGSTVYSRTTNLAVINYFEEIPRKKD